MNTSPSATPPRLRTLLDILEGIAGSPRSDLLGSKKGGTFRFLDSAEFVTRVRGLSCFLRALGVAPGDRVAIVSENRPEWTICDFAIQSLGAVSVPLYTTVSAEQAAYILRDAGCGVALVSTRRQFEKIVTAARKARALRHLVVFDRWPDYPTAVVPHGVIEPHGGAAAEQFRVVPGSPPAVEPEAGPPREGAIEVTFLDEALRRGALIDADDPAEFGRRSSGVRPDDLAAILYTSGTTGDPKGVMLSHRNFCSNVEACRAVLSFSREDIALSFLPLTHAFERTATFAYLSAGGSIAFAESFDTLATDIRVLRPTVVTTVPRLLEKIQARVVDAARSGPAWRRRLFDLALDAGRRKLGLVLAGSKVPPGLALRCLLAERLVFSRIKERMGGRLKFLISGGAPLSRETCEFFLAAGVLVLEGYGLTETSPVIAVNTPQRLRPGTVGPVLPGVEVRIESDGEILVRGPNVMTGYFGKQEETDEIMRDGWLATGDIGFLDADGFLAITDRKKEMIITTGGKNIAPQPIENALKAGQFIANAVLIGDRRNYVSALIVPDFEAIERFAADRGLAAQPRGELLRRAEILDLFAAEIDAANSRFGIQERVRKFALLDRDLTVEDGEITPTLKVRRRVVLEKYGSLIESLYTG
jgi:long-chain acyl-CoA synthetase